MVRLDPSILTALAGIPYRLKQTGDGGVLVTDETGRTITRMSKYAAAGKADFRTQRNVVAEVRRRARELGLAPVENPPAQEEPSMGKNTVSESNIKAVWSVLLQLAKGDVVDARQQEIASKAGIGQSTASRALEALEARGALVRVSGEPLPGLTGIVHPQSFLLAHTAPDYRAKPEPKPVSTTAIVTEAAIVLPSKADEPRKPTPAENRKIMDAVEAAYAGEKIGYRAGQSDETIATELNLPRAWITAVREQFYGPERVIDLAGLARRLNDVSDKISAMEREIARDRDATKAREGLLTGFRVELDIIRNTIKGIA